MEMCMRVNGAWGNSTIVENRYTLTEVRIKEILFMGKETVKVSSFQLMEVATWESGKTA